MNDTYTRSSVAGVEQSFDLGVLFDRIHVGAFGDSRDHVLPGLAAIVRAVDVRLVVGDAMAVHGSVGRFGIEMAGFNLRHFAPRSHRRRRHVVPGLAVVARHVDQSVVGADPDGLGVERRGSDGVHHAEAVDHYFIDVFRGERIERGRYVGLHACQVGADFLPGAAAVARAEDELIRVIHGFVGQREDLRQRPRLAIRIVGIGRRQLAAERCGHVQGLIAAPAPLP